MTTEALNNGSSLETTLEVRNRVKDLMQANGWETLEYLGIPASQVELLQVDRDLPEPEEATEIRRQTWQGKLAEKQAELQAANPSSTYLIHDDTQTGNMALFEQTADGQQKRKMWAGTTITLAQQGISWDGKKLKVPVYPISYSEWVACYSPDYAKAFRDKNFPLPYAGLGVSVLMETTDGFFPLTRRGIETPVYPGRLYSPGGGPKPGETSSEAILSEILEEIGLQKGVHFDPEKLTILALVSDTHFADSEHARPELVAYLPVNVNYRTVETIQHEQSVKKGQRQEDVWGVVPISTFTPNLQREIIYGGFEMCPPTEAGLAHAVFHLVNQKEGFEAAFQQTEEMMKRLKSFDRSQYIPPISRLPVT